MAWQRRPHVRALRLQCIVYMGATDVERQAPNVFRMKLLGAEVVPVTSGRSTLKDAMNEALRDWVTNVGRHVLLHRHGCRPAPLSGHGARLPVGHRRGNQAPDDGARRPLPDSLIAAIGGGSNAMGLFHPFLDDKSVQIFGVEAAGKGRRHGRARSLDHRWTPRRAAWQPHLPADGRGRPDQ
jgi:tryptophan synthase beta chain